MHRLLILLAAVLVLAGLAPTAEAEEVFVLDGGSVVRGTAVRETEDTIVVRLNSYYDENTITLRRVEITKRYVLKGDPDEHPEIDTDVDAPEDALPLAGRPGVPHTIVLARDSALVGSGPTGREQDERRTESLASEGFIERVDRVVNEAMPQALESRMGLGLLLLVVLAAFVAGGTRLLGMKAASLQASTTLGFLLGVFLVADTIWHTELLRADRAIWIIPVQGVIWLGVARSSLEAPISRTIPLLALMLFAATAFAFAVGSVLVSL